MKLSKKYDEFMRGGENQKLTKLAWKKLKQYMLKKRSSINLQSHKHSDAVLRIKICNNHPCPACDESFSVYSSFINETSLAVNYFNQRAKKLLKLHHHHHHQAVAGFRKHFIVLFKGKALQERIHVSLLEEAKALVSFALTKATETQKLVKKFDEMGYCCNQGLALKSKAKRMQNEILHSPWLRELMAMHINLARETDVYYSGIAAAATPPPCEDEYRVRFNEGGSNPSLSCEHIGSSFKIDVDLTCPLCLEIVFDPICLRCGHIMCKLCACSAASVTIVDGLKSSHPKQKCPLCRQAGVYGGAVRMTEINILLSRRYREYWERRLRIEREERLQQAKKYWESQTRVFVGI